MATIVKTSSGAWKAIIRRTGWPQTSKNFRLRRDAEDWARRTEDEMVRGAFIQRTPSEKMTVAVALERYERDITPLKKPSTQRGDRTRIREVKKAFGAYSLAGVTPDLVAKFRDQRLGEGKANNTVRLELALLGHLYTIAIKEWHIGLVHNPVASIRRPSQGAGRDRRLTPKEQKRLLQAVDEYSNPMLGWIVRIAIETGMRHSEIMGLHCTQVDLRRRIVRLADTKNNSARTVPLTQVATDAFRQALHNPLRPDGTDLVFFGEKKQHGKPGRGPYTFNKPWAEIKKRLGLDDLHFHDLRHEAVSRFVEMGLSDQEVSAISGHKSMQMLKRYTHLRAEDLVSKLDKLTG